jgi:C4-dicarboxylate transporter, DctM subunit
MLLRVPVGMAMGLDPIWFGVIIVMVAELGLIHPPVGMNIFYGVLPFTFTDILRLILLIAFPILALWLPSKMG